MGNEMAGFCGDYCGKCPNYPDECRGCVPEDHKDCCFVECCLERGIEHCGLCRDFPCPQLADFCPDDRPGCPPGYHIENLRLRSEIGSDSWLERQKRIWPESRKPRD